MTGAWQRGGERQKKTRGNARKGERGKWTRGKSVSERWKCKKEVTKRRKMRWQMSISGERHQHRKGTHVHPMSGDSQHSFHFA